MKEYRQRVLHTINAALLVTAGFQVSAQPLPQTDTHRFDTPATLPVPADLIQRAPVQADVSRFGEAQLPRFSADSDETSNQMAHYASTYRTLLQQAFEYARLPRPFAMTV